MQKKKLLTLLLAAFMLFSGFGISAKAESEFEIEFGELSEEFQSYLKFPQLGGSDKNGLIPSPIDLHTDYEELERFKPLRGSYPARYDLRETGRLTPIRDQGPNGSCWAFACYGALESYLRPYAYFDFSEKHMRNTHGFDFHPKDGGNREMSTAYLARWSGPVAESDDPYSASDFYSDPNLPRRQDLIHSLYLPPKRNATDNDIIKAALMKYGAISTIVNGSEYYLNRRTAAFYDYNNSQANHAVVIVGWDDNYSRNNFSTRPPGDGAYIVRNSWGANWGDRGYYYVSYYSANVGYQNTVYITENMGKRDSVWQYDWLGQTNNIGLGRDSAYMANLFGPVKKNTSINSVGFYAPSNGAEYVVYINPDVRNNDIGGNKIKVAEGRFTYAGYHVVDFKGIEVNRGAKFAPIVYIRTPRYSKPIAVEQPYRGFSSRATSNRGESFVSNDGNYFEDLYNSSRGTNVCLKAFGGKGGGTPGPNPPTPIEDAEMKVEVKPAKEVYKPGEVMKVTVSVKDEKKKAVSGAEVNLRLSTPSGKIYRDELRTDAKGEAHYEAQLHSQALEGTYKFDVEVSKYGYKDAKGKASIKCSANGHVDPEPTEPEPTEPDEPEPTEPDDPQIDALDMRIQPQAESYNLGDTATFTINVKNKGRSVYNAKVEGVIITPSGNEYRFSKSTNYYGQAVLQVRTQTNAPAGFYKVKATASKAGFADAEAESGVNFVDPYQPGYGDAITVKVVKGSTRYRRGETADIYFEATYADGTPASGEDVQFTVSMPWKNDQYYKGTTDSNGLVRIQIRSNYRSSRGRYSVTAEVGSNGQSASATHQYYLR